MLYALALAALAAVPAQTGPLKLTNVRFTIGELGPARDAKFLPGEIPYLAFDMNGLTIEADGTTKFKLATKVTDSKGKVILQRDPQDIVHFVPLRGNSVPGRVYILLGLDQDPGTYVLEVTVEDTKTKAKDTASVKFEVAKREFGIVAVYTSYDEKGEISAPNIGVVGQAIMIQFSVVSFERDPKTKQPRVEHQYQFLDEKGVPILAEPIKQIQDKGVKLDEGVMSFRFPLYLNRPGKFTAILTATDLVANKKSTYKLPVTINPAP